MPYDIQLAFMQWLTTFIVVTVLAMEGYVLLSLAFYKAFQKADIKNAWIAWVPIACAWPYMKVIKTCAWNLLWLFVPVANIVFCVIWQQRFFKAFGINHRWALIFVGCIVPVLNGLVAIFFITLYCMIGFDSTRQYDPHFGMTSSNSPDADKTA